jgi:uncharacterized protein (DUF1684 family)
MRTLWLMIPVLLVIGGCTGSDRPARKSFNNDLEKWKSQRIERLKARDGWLNLAGLYWLEEGDNSIGSDSGNHVVFPAKAPSSIGHYTLRGEEIQFTANPGTEVKSGDSIVTEIEVFTDKSKSPTLLETGSLAWFVIQRGEKFGIRLRDFEHPALREFHSIEYYDSDPDWIIEARFEAYEEPREMLIPTVLGTFEKNLCPGVLRFSVGDIGQELYPSQAGKGFFLIFADETSGLETYGGGRFLYAGEPDKEGVVKLDFNRACNPPCAFTPFATCPLPPRENFLSVSILAGEKFSGH